MSAKIKNDVSLNFLDQGELLVIENKQSCLKPNTNALQRLAKSKKWVICTCLESTVRDEYIFELFAMKTSALG